MRHYWLHYHTQRSLQPVRTGRRNRQPHAAGDVIPPTHPPPPRLLHTPHTPHSAVCGAREHPSSNQITHLPPSISLKDCVLKTWTKQYCQLFQGTVCCVLSTRRSLPFSSTSHESVGPSWQCAAKCVPFLLGKLARVLPNDRHRPRVGEMRTYAISTTWRAFSCFFLLLQFQPFDTNRSIEKEHIFYG